jgi:hypothetical protein
MPRQEGLTYGSGVKSEYVRLELHRKQMIERKQHDEQHQAKAKADADQLLLHGQQGLDVAARRFRSLSSERRLETREEQPGNQQSHPDHEAEQAYDINRREFSKTVLP